jgi:Fur family ferric uptake transcriptional regulator
MKYKKEIELFEDYIRSKNLRQSEQRIQVLEVFLKSEKHLTADELYRMVKKKNPSIGTATIYRTLKLLRESGLCRELKLDDDHDHIICTSCGRLVEVLEPEIEKLQEKLAKTHGFLIKNHKLEMYGLCKRCSS